MVDFAKLRAGKKGSVKMEDAKWECPPYGNHSAICIDVLGFEKESWSEKNKRTFTTKVIYLVWLVYPRNDVGGTIWDSKGEPFKVDRQFNPTLDPQNKYGFYEITKSWAGRELKPEEIEHFDPVDLIGKAGMIEIDNKQGTSGTIYPVVVTIEPHPDPNGKWTSDLRADGYKPRDYSFQLKARIPAKTSQPAGESAWEADKTDDDVPF